MDVVENRKTAVDAAVLWQTYHPQIYRYLLGLTGERETAEDLTQETFLQVMRGAGPMTNERAWLFRVATNRAMDHFRRRRLVAWLPFVAARYDAAVPDGAEALGEQELVRLALRRLPRETAALLMLREAEGFTAVEIAEMTGEGYEAVRKRIARARETFRQEYLRLKGEDA